jgi:hypothetical protein
MRGRRITMEVTAGIPARELVSSARQRGAGLLVVGSTGKQKGAIFGGKCVRERRASCYLFGACRSAAVTSRQHRPRYSREFNTLKCRSK